MPLGNTPIQRKLVTIFLLTSGTVLLLTCTVFVVYEVLTFRQAEMRHLSTIGEVVAANSTAALAFDNQDDAREILSALKAEKHIVAGGLYDRSGHLFSKFPENLPDSSFPPGPGAEGYGFKEWHLEGFTRVAQGKTPLGTLYLKSDLAAMFERLGLYGGVVTLVSLVSLLVAYLLSKRLQKEISQPILALAETAKAVSARQDYSVRAPAARGEELRLLTEAFNHMLEQIQGQTRALSESEGRVRAVLNSALSAVVVVDVEEKIHDWNARAEAMFGWTRQEVIGKGLAEFLPERHRASFRERLERLLEAGASEPTVELEALRHDGSEFPAELSMSMLKTGKVVTFCAFITDITERKEAESKLKAQLSRLHLLSQTTRAIGERLDLSSIFQVVVRSLEDNLPIDFGCICLYDAAGAQLTVSCVGSSSEALASVMGMKQQSLIPIDQNGLAHCIRGNLVYEPDIIDSTFPFPKRLAAGGLRALVIAPLLVESKVFGVLIAARKPADSFSSVECEFLRQLSEHVALAAHQAQLYTILQQAYDDLRQTQQAVMQQERLKALGQMASGIAHDINNAISPVALYTESLLEKEPNLSERARKYLTTIQRAIEDVAATVGRMREFYRSREQQAALSSVQLNGLVQHVVDLTRARWNDMPQQQGEMILLKTELASSLPLVLGMESEIRDALTNLIFNAVDAMPNGGTLTIRTRRIHDAEDTAMPAVPGRICVEVSDTGIGMDEETRRRCLEPFYTTKGERGTGLGLAMVYGMVKRHGAEMEIESTPGEGTRVRLVFAIPVTDTVVAPYLSTPPKMTGLRLLLVDDDPLLIHSLRDTLEEEGHVITVADGGQAGISALNAAQQKGEGFDAVITDLGMPYVDGRKMAAAVKNTMPSVPVILLTGWGQRLLAEGDIPLHVDRVLSKPPKLRELREALAALCLMSSQAEKQKDT